MSSPVLSSLPDLVDIDATFLPVGHMRQISRVTHLSGAEIAAELDLDGHWVFPEHFPDDPIFPGSLLIESAGQLVALWAWQGGLHGPPRLVRTSAEFHRPVTPAVSAITLHASVRRKRHLHFGTVEIRALKERVATVDVVLAVLAG